LKKDFRKTFIKEIVQKFANFRQKSQLKIRQMKNIEILAEHSSFGPGVEIHEIY
jgi:hypothetical protein